MNVFWKIEHQKCTPKSKHKLLCYLQLNRSWWRPSSLAGNMTGVYWTTAYQLKKALDELVASGDLEWKLFERGHFRYFAYRAKVKITYEQYKEIYPK